MKSKMAENITNGSNAIFLMLAPLEELVGSEAAPVLRVVWDDIGEVEFCRVFTSSWLDMLLGIGVGLVAALLIEDVVFQ
jgi:hypothetical protein